MNKKLRKFRENQQIIKEVNKRKRIYEEFTLKGFFIVSFYAIFVSIFISPALSFLGLLGFNPELSWKWGFTLYFLGWIFSFWIFCLVPKMNRKDDDFLHDWEK